MNVRARRSALARRHSIIVFMMSAIASPASVVRGPLPIHLDTLSRVVSLSHKYSRSVPADVACSVCASAATPFLLCVLIRLQLMFLLGNHNTLDAPPLYLASKVVRDLAALGVSGCLLLT